MCAQMQLLWQKLLRNWTLALPLHSKWVLRETRRGQPQLKENYVLKEQLEVKKWEDMGDRAMKLYHGCSVWFKLVLDFDQDHKKKCFNESTCFCPAGQWMQVLLEL